MLIPDNELASWPNLAVNGDKEGGLWFVDRTKPNGINSCSSNTCDQQPCKNAPPNNVQTYLASNRTIHTSPAFWDHDLVDPSVSYMYVAAIGEQLFQYALCGSSTTGPIDYTTCPGPGGGSPVGSVDANGVPVNFYCGVTPTVSAAAAGTSDALVWAIGVNQSDGCGAQGANPGVLYAFDAVTMKQLYASNNGCAADAIGPPTKRSVPTVANGYVYLGTEQAGTGQGTFYIFGLNRPSC